MEGGGSVVTFTPKMIALKMIGDKNVPSGRVTWVTDVNPGNVLMVHTAVVSRSVYHGYRHMGGPLSLSLLSVCVWVSLSLYVCV